MSDSISRLGIVVEEKGLREALQGLDKLIMLMEKAESKASSPIAVKVDSSNVEASAAKVLKSNTDIANSEKSVASATQQAQTIVVEAKNKGADAAVSSAESSSNTGAMALHGPHQVAQKSTNTGVSDCSTAFSNVPSSA